MKCCTGLAFVALLAAQTVAVGCAPTVPPNACTVSNGGCDPNAFCTTNGTAPVCTCFPGFSGNGLSCAPASPCTNDFGGCDVNATCVASSIFSVCQCKTGYIGDGFHCEPQPMCGVQNGGCDPNATCMEVEGLVNCTCKTNYVGNGLSCRTCTSATCGPNASCSVDSTDNRIDCTCDDGYVPATGGEVGCVPKNNCVVNNGGCSPNATCTPTDGGMPECACNPDYIGDGGVCNPVTTCVMDNGGCDPQAQCMDSPTGPICTCPTGYVTTNAGVTCTSAYCEQKLDDCDPNAACSDFPPPFSCTCKPGYTGLGTTCTEIDGCNPDPCGANETCTSNTNGPGTFSCACSTGFQNEAMDGGISCEAVNKCSGTKSPCTGAHEACEYTGPGEYSCGCQTGYQMELTDGGEACEPIDACKETPSPCLANETCTKTGPGTASCACNSPYEMSGGACVPINHCDDTPPPCDPNAKCTFTGPATYTCACNAGFTGTGKSCQSHYIQVAIGDRHMCAIREDDPNSMMDGTLWCWGWNDDGQLGIGSTSSTAPILTPVSVQVSGTAVPVFWSYVAAGTNDTCAIVSNSAANPSTQRNALYCWGNNTDEQVGTGSATATYVSPQQIAKGYTWYSVGSAGYHTCGSANGGNIYCWGLNASGQLGLGSLASPQSAPTLLTGSAGQYGSVSIGTNHTCTLDATFLQCWGDDTYDQLAIPTSSLFPVWATKTVYTGGQFVTANGYVWEANMVEPPDTSAATGTGPVVGSTCQTSTAVVDANVTWQCVGPTSPTTCRMNPNECIAPSPQQASLPSQQYTDPVCALSGCGAASGTPGGDQSWQSVTAGQFGTCGIQSDNSLWCWGANDRGQVGINSLANPQPVPIAVHDATGSFGQWSDVALGSEHACALNTTGNVYCWGDNTSGQLGIGTYSSYKLTPVAVTFPSTEMANFISITSNPGNCPSNKISTNGMGTCNTGLYGGIYTCAIDSNYELWCWGEPSSSSEQIYSFGISPTLMTQ